MSYTLRKVAITSEWKSFFMNVHSVALFQSWEWGDVLLKSGVDVRRLGIFEGNKLVGIAQTVKVNAKRGTYLHVRHGPVWMDGKTDWTWFARAIKQLALEEHAWFVRMSPLIPASGENETRMRQLGCVPSPVHEVDAERCWVLDINKSEEELLMGMRKTTRYEIRTAQKVGVEVIASTSVSDIVHFTRLYEETVSRHGFVGHTAISEEFSVFSKTGNALLFLGRFEGKVMAAAIILFIGDQAIYHHGASLSSKIPVSHLVQWEAIREAKKRGMTLYNFYGIAPDDAPNHPWRGITVFKKGFGGREALWLHAHDIPVSPLYGVTWVIETMQRKMKGYA